jgi:hypothetical protein
MGWAKNRWVRLFLAVWVLWAAVDASILLLQYVFPGHYDAHGIYRQSGVQAFFSHYEMYLYPENFPNRMKLIAVARIGPAIAASTYVAWRLAFGRDATPTST